MTSIFLNVQSPACKKEPKARIWGGCGVVKVAEKEAARLNWVSLGSLSPDKKVSALRISMSTCLPRLVSFGLRKKLGI